jgi:hypothetical protein
MQLSLKQKALFQTIGLFALAIPVAIIVTYIVANVSTTVLLNAVGVGFFVWFGYLFYGITLSRLEHQETLKELNKKFDK